ncbi:MAG: sodium:solute symporter family protein [Peptococcaceae bacterium]|nr:sodium:solute symporter family protein [Peptococcaceae bacterium]
MVPLLIAVLYFAVLTFGCSYMLRKEVTSGAEFATAANKLSWPLVMVGFVLLPLGGGHTLSLWEMSAGLGASAIFWGLISGSIFVPLFMLWFGPWFRRLNVQTVPEAFSKMYGRDLGQIFAIVGPATWIGICIAECSTVATAIYALSGGAIPFAPWSILLAVFFTVLYIYTAGMLQVAWMNIFNAIVLIGGSFLALFYTGSWLANGHGGWEGVAATYAAAGEAWKTNPFNFSPDVIFAIIIPMTFCITFFCSSEQTCYMPILSAKTDADVRKGVFWAAGINSLACFPWVMIGLVAMSIPAIAAGGAKLSVPNFALMALPPWVTGIMMIALMAACLSTSGALLLASSQVIVHDVLKKALNPKMSDATFLKLSRLSIIVLAVVVAIPALMLPMIFPIFMWCFTFGIPIFTCYLIGLLWKRNRAATWINVIASFAVSFIWTFWTPNILPPQISLNIYPVTMCTVGLGIVLNLILPGKPGLLRQIKTAEKSFVGA